MSWILWLIGVVIAVIVGLAVFAGIEVPVVTAQIKSFDANLAKTAVVAAGLIAISKFF
jgi:hypothetical protein